MGIIYFHLYVSKVKLTVKYTYYVVHHEPMMVWIAPPGTSTYSKFSFVFIVDEKST